MNGDIEFVKDPVSLTSVAQSTGPQILSVYPNPANDMIRIVLNGKMAGTSGLKLHDFTGKLVLNKVIDPGIGLQELDLDISELQPGGYIISIIDQQGISHRKLQVAR